MSVRNTENDTRPDHVGTQREDFFHQAAIERTEWALKVDPEGVKRFDEQNEARRRRP